MDAIKEPIQCHIRWMIRRDMAEVQQIENASFQDGWTEEAFLQALRQRNCIGMIGEINHVVGFMVYELHKSRLELLNFAVHPNIRRLGIGTRLINKLKDRLSAHRRIAITLQVRETKPAGPTFLQGAGLPRHPGAAPALRGYARGRFRHGLRIRSRPNAGPERAGDPGNE